MHYRRQLPCIVFVCENEIVQKLTEQNWVISKANNQDKRRKHLFLSEVGHQIALDMLNLQCRLLSRAYKNAGADAVEGLWDVLQGLINEQDRQILLSKRLSDQNRPQNILKKIRK